ncbi:MAG: hypothetical protein P1U41_08540 [Vicingaceae bacterium]|nr:hypothetical protein [Vicingaceae bacterium]
MKQLITYTIIIVLSLLTFSCSEPVHERIDRINTVKEKLDYLGKTIEEIKTIEDAAALVKEDEYLIEYEYPIREDDTYVITYRFKSAICYELNIDAYLEKESHAKKVMKEILIDMANNESFGETSLKNQIYTWISTNNNTLVEFNILNIERGIVNLHVKSLK